MEKNTIVTFVSPGIFYLGISYPLCGPFYHIVNGESCFLFLKTGDISSKPGVMEGGRCEGEPALSPACPCPTHRPPTKCAAFCGDQQTQLWLHLCQWASPSPSARAQVALVSGPRVLSGTHGRAWPFHSAILRPSPHGHPLLLVHCKLGHLADISWQPKIHPGKRQYLQGDPSDTRASWSLTSWPLTPCAVSRVRSSHPSHILSLFPSLPCLSAAHLPSSSCPWFPTLPPAPRNWIHTAAGSGTWVPSCCSSSGMPFGHPCCLRVLRLSRNPFHGLRGCSAFPAPAATFPHDSEACSLPEQTTPSQCPSLVLAGS